MTSKERAYLRSLASNISPIYQIGKAGVTPELTAGVCEAFNSRELIKVSVLKNCMDTPFNVANTLAERTGSQVVQVIGKKIVLYKENADLKKKNKSIFK